MGILGSLFKVGASLIGGNSAKKASKNAQAAQVAAIGQAQDTLNDQYDDAVSLSSPWTAGGATAQDALLELLGLASPGTAGTTDWAAYAMSNPDVAAEWQRIKGNGDFSDIGEYGQWHYNRFGQAEGRDLAPYTTGATPATSGDATGAIAALKDSPVYKALFGNAVDTTLANASATGGLRGGNTQDALARVGVDTLAKVYQDRVNQLGSVSNTGLAATGNIMDLGADNAASLAALFGKQGDVNAGGILQRGAINSNMLDSIAGAVGSATEGISLKDIGNTLRKIF